jgi:hypothetical protein
MDLDQLQGSSFKSRVSKGHIRAVSYVIPRIDLYNCRVKQRIIVSEMEYTRSPVPILLRPPKHIRDRIYALVLGAEDPIRWPREASQFKTQRTALLLTSREIYHDAISILYKSNTLLFKHPSDCNMFLYYHQMKLAKQIRSLLLHIHAKEYMLWTGYFGSSFEYRSLKADYPKLESLHVVILSERTLRDNEVNVVLGFQQWKADKPLKNICLSLLERADLGLKCKILYLKLVSDEQEMQEILDAYPKHVFPPEFQANPYLRTLPREFHQRENIQVSLDATPANLFYDNPWNTEQLFEL